MRSRPILSAREIEQRATAFRAEYAPTADGIFDLEVVIEHDLGIDIVPRPDVILRTGRKAWLSCNGRAIIVDETFQRDHFEEYRFTIAHELGHAQLHWSLLPQRPFRNRDEFRAYHAQQRPENLLWLEWQAREWAGRVLMPPQVLSRVFNAERTRARMRGLRGDAMKYAVEAGTATYFGVTVPCAAVRIHKDRLWDMGQDGARIAS